MCHKNDSAAQKEAKKQPPKNQRDDRQLNGPNRPST